MDTTFIRVFGAAAAARCLPATGNHTAGKTCSLFDVRRCNPGWARSPQVLLCVLALFKARRNNNVPSYWLKAVF